MGKGSDIRQKMAFYGDNYLLVSTLEFEHVVDSASSLQALLTRITDRSREIHLEIDFVEQ